VSDKLDWAFSFDDIKWMDLGLNKCRTCFLFLFFCIFPSEFTKPLTYFFWYPSLHWLNNVNCLFLSFPLIKSGVPIIVH
jgi:hypothetical protein